MTLELLDRPPASGPGNHRFRLHRAGILNVWQYDEQVFTFADGRMLLRGANGAGKSKTLEMLLPFALDGDKARLTASAKHHTSLLWLMTDGVDGGNRVGYVWVEFARTTEEGAEEFFTCGVGIRASSSARQATAWHFATERRVGVDLALEDAAGPLPLGRLREELGADRVFERAADYKAFVGRALFGLDLRQYDEVLRLLYWLRQPQVGEDIEPARLTQQLSQALPQLDEQSVRAAADTFDELTAFGEQIDRRGAAAEALTALAEGYAVYAQAVLATRARSVAESVQQERRLRGAVDAARQALTDVERRRDEAQDALVSAEAGAEHDQARLRALEESPEFRDQRRLDELGQHAQRDARLAREAESRVARAQAVTSRTEASLAGRRRELEEGIAQLVTAVHKVGEDLRRSVPGAHLSTTLSAQAVGDAAAAPDGVAGHGHDAEHALTAALDRLGPSMAGVSSAVSQRRAAVGVVVESLAAVTAAEMHQSVAEREAEQTEARWEEARAARVSAEETSEEALRALLQAITEWVSLPGAPEVELPDELTPETVAGLERLGTRSAAPRLADLRDDLGRSRAAGESARATLQRLHTTRAAVEAERDPAPPAPALPRTDRPDGHALWQVVDFADGLSSQERAGLEAALQASGLLDAWVRPGGRLLDDDHQDVVLVPPRKEALDEGGGPRLPTLDQALVVDLPEGSDLLTDDVARVLRSLGMRTDGPTGSGESSHGDAAGGVDDLDGSHRQEDTGGARASVGVAEAWVGLDGSWRLGPAQGRAVKDVAQYVGSTARAEERSRRLAALDAEIEEAEGALAGAEHEQARISAQARQLEEWAADVPTGHALRSAWDRLEVRLDAEHREEQRNQQVQAAAQEARAQTAHLTGQLHRLADEHELPADGNALAALDESLRSLAEALRDLARDEDHVRRLLSSWVQALDDHTAAAAVLSDESLAAADAVRRAEVSAAQFEELRASVGESVAELNRRIAATRATLDEHRAVAASSRRALDALLVDLGQARTGVAAAEDRLAEHRSTRSAVLAALVEAASLPGVLEAAEVDGETADAVLALEGLHPTAAVPRPALTAVRDLGALSTVEVPSATTQLFQRYGSATSGPAAEHQPVLSTHGELHTLSGRDEAGEAVLTTLAKRVTASVERDRGLLTQREKEQFERHVLGELGEALRRCRRDAQELVDAMNIQLGEVSTSQGIRVKLDWKLRDDVAAEAREAVNLLTQPVGALLPEERAALRDALHRLIEASRAERPELSYSEHLAAALDYRTWFAFTIRYTRPERLGKWDRLHRRSPLSQGEQKVLCYLPLFAAAAAHFTSLAGAAPYAPRLVLLDDAFPKIDVRTHPLLFGLLVQLDLDFVITSERLWGDHATVPSLAIYEALRDPGQRGIAQYEYRWDGRTLESVG